MIVNRHPRTGINLQTIYKLELEPKMNENLICLKAEFRFYSLF